MQIERRISDRDFQCEQDHRHDHKNDGAKKSELLASLIFRYSEITTYKLRVKTAIKFSDMAVPTVRPLPNLALGKMGSWSLSRF